MEIRSRRSLIMFALIIAGETVFLLPFVVARIFRPTFLDVFGLTNLQLGTAFALYGTVAMVSYLLGGPLADRFSARKLMTLALIATSFGGILFVTVPSMAVLTLLYGFWGFTTILLFWAALIRATREWGSISAQGLAYGLLDGGRGLFAAVLASSAVWVFALLLPEDVASATLEQRSNALVWIIWIFTALVLAVGLLVWLAVPEQKLTSKYASKTQIGVGLKKLIRRRDVWLQALIVTCAYVGYKVTDDFSLYVSDAFAFHDVEAAQIGTISFWVRPLAAVGAGFFADRFSASKVTIIGFLLVIVGSLFIALGLLNPHLYWLLCMVIVTTSTGIYALRGIYFALLQQARVPLVYTGSAVGLVSMIGFTPDIFMGPLMGFLIDRSPGAIGHQHVFLVLAMFSTVGLIATFQFQRLTRPKEQKLD